jgi:hypothetical protein
VPRSLFGLWAVAIWAAAAVGQQPYQPTFPPPAYPPQTTTAAGRPILSPYLNLLNGVNPALNYYYGVQPYTQPQRSIGPAPTGFAPAAPGTFFRPTVPQTTATPYPEPTDRQRFKLPSPGLPVSYGTGAGTTGRTGLFAPPAGPSGAAPGGQPQPPATIPRSK